MSASSNNAVRAVDKSGAGLLGQRLVAAGILALGIVLAVASSLLPNPSGYAQIGPRVFPQLVATGLIVVGAILLVEALRSGFRNLAEEAREAFNWHAFLWISGGLIAHMALVAHLGFILATALLFAAVARGFGSSRALRDIAMGLAVTVSVYVLFTKVLTLNLPWGTWIPG